LQQLQRNLDSLYNNSLMLVGGKTKRCRDNKRDTEAKPGGSGFKNGAESTTNDFKVYCRRPKRFKEIKWNCFIWPKELIIWKVFQQKLSLVRVTRFLSTVMMKFFGFYLDFLAISITWSLVFNNSFVVFLSILFSL
jgi:hypothetical protein